MAPPPTTTATKAPPRSLKVKRSSQTKWNHAVAPQALFLQLLFPRKISDDLLYFYSLYFSKVP
jgi:hypothetical protein